MNRREKGWPSKLNAGRRHSPNAILGPGTSRQRTLQVLSLLEVAAGHAVDSYSRQGEVDSEVVKPTPQMEACVLA
jgi:hypothetical protein